MPSAPFRFDANLHEYIDALGVVRPHITGMLEACGEIDDRWYTEESSERGRHVHSLTADFDLGALEVKTCVSPWRGYLLGHVAATDVMRGHGLEWHDVEVPLMHPVYYYGGRPDRVATYSGLGAIVEGKSGDIEKSHQIQTALQAILVSACGVLPLPPEAIARFCLYWRDNGKYKLIEHRERRDFNRAREIIRRCCQ